MVLSQNQVFCVKSLVPATALNVLLTGVYGQVLWSDSKVFW